MKRRRMRDGGGSDDDSVEDTERASRRAPRARSEGDRGGRQAKSPRVEEPTKTWKVANVNDIKNKAKRESSRPSVGLHGHVHVHVYMEPLETPIAKSFNSLKPHETLKPKRILPTN